MHRSVVAREVDHEGATDAGRDSFMREQLHHVEQITRAPPPTLLDQNYTLVTSGWKLIRAARRGGHPHNANGSSIIASAPSVKLGHPHPVSAFSPATPSPHTILARVVEKSGAF